MSASREKKLRKAGQLDQAGTNPRKSVEGGNWQRNTTIGICVFLALVVLLFVILGSGLPQRTFSAMTVGTEKISVAEFNFHLYSSVNSYVSSMSSYGSSASDMGLDPEKPLDEQPYPLSSDGKQSWGSYFKDQTVTSLTQLTDLYLEAKANGVTLPPEEQQNVESSINNLKEYCASNNTTLSKYLSDTYGRGVNEDVLRTALMRANLASYYSNEKQKKYTYSDDQITSYYNSHKTDIDYVDYRSFVVSGTPETKTDSTGKTVDPTDEEKKAAMDAAKQKADAMLAAITDEASFNTLAAQNAPDADKSKYESDANATLTKKGTAASLSEDMKNWLYDNARKTGDKTVIASDTDYTVVYMVKRYRDDENTVNVRHILIQPVASEGSTTATDAQKAEAKEKAQSLYDEWKKGPATEDSFAELAKENSSDTGSSSEGGLYENVYNGQMVSAFNDWCFDPTRKPGDTGIVETDYGYHIIYFIGVSTPHWKVQVKDTMVSNDYNDYMGQIKDKYPAKNNSFGMSLSGTK